MTAPSAVIPAKAGISCCMRRARLNEAPAFAGVTETFCD